MIGLTQVCVLALVAVATAFPQAPAKEIAIVRQESDGPNPDGSYRYSFDTENGISQQESGHLENVGSEAEAIVVDGSNSYTSPDGQVITLTYNAGPQGFVPQGAHLPTSPPIPPEIQRALDFIASQPSTPETPGRRY